MYSASTEFTKQPHLQCYPHHGDRYPCHIICTSIDPHRNRHYTLPPPTHSPIIGKGIKKINNPVRTHAQA